MAALGHAERVGERAHLGLAEPGLEQRVDDSVLARGHEAWPPVAFVVGVRARGQRRVAALRGQRREGVVELALAVVATVGVVGAVARAGQLVGRDDLVRDADGLGHGARAGRARRSRARGRPP